MISCAGELCDFILFKLGKKYSVRCWSEVKILGHHGHCEIEFLVITIKSLKCSQE